MPPVQSPGSVASDDTLTTYFTTPAPSVACAFAQLKVIVPVPPVTVRFAAVPSTGLVVSVQLFASPLFV
jgi:hypothetical protein